MLQNPCRSTHVIRLLLAIILTCLSQAGRADSSSLCNKGSASLYFATVGELDNIFQSGAMVQGLVEVAPNSCANLVPDGMNKVILTFFMKDSRGILTNKYFVPTNATKVNDTIRHVCVNMQQPYRLFGSKAKIFSTYVNATCPSGFSPARPAWIHQPGGITTYNIEAHTSGPETPWRDLSGREFTDPPVLRVGPLQSAGSMVEVNQSSLRDYQAAQALLEAAKEFKERSDREAQERQARIWAEQQRRRKIYDAQVDKAEESLLRPSDEACAQYSDKPKYKKGNSVALSGVRLTMDLTSAHEALVCNGFTINPETLAKAGGVEKFWANAREKTFQKTLADGTTVFTDVETRPPRGAPAGADFVVITVRIRYRLVEQLDASGWRKIKNGFKDKYKVGKQAENDVAIHVQFKNKLGQHFLRLDALDYRNGSVSQYSISLL